MLNSVLGLLLLLMSWCRIARQYAPELATPTAFWQHCRPIVFGDDFLVSKSDEVDWFTLPRLIEAVKEFGMTMTPEDKSSIAEDYKLITQCTFLKCHFMKVQGIWRMCLKKETIYEMTNWITACSNVEEVTNSKCNTALQMMAAWGETDWNILHKKLRDAATFVGSSMVFDTFSSALYQVNRAHGLVDHYDGPSRKVWTLENEFILDKLPVEQPKKLRGYAPWESVFMGNN